MLHRNMQVRSFFCVVKKDFRRVSHSAKNQEQNKKRSCTLTAVFFIYVPENFDCFIALNWRHLMDDREGILWKSMNI